MDAHHNTEVWYTNLPLLPGISKTTELGDELIEIWDEEQLDIARQLYEELSRKESKACLLGITTYAMFSEITSTLRKK